ncbi:60S ribosomal protein L31-like [Phyllostomus hastatus]|uniref:60S ribosomal protein L31-like n=1 Tax=Phyllostomus hastatus TaxID=9423 RepID=UPI001E680405|nr:60S ribosomal protein L31-like [Phyllostomus hastatus]
MQEEGPSAINAVVTRENTTNIHKCIHGVGCKKHVPQVLTEIQKFARREMGTKDVLIDSWFSKAVWTKGIRNVPCWIWMQLSRKYNEDEDSPNRLYTLATYVPATTFKNL